MTLFEVKDLGKAGFLPYYMENGVPVFLFMESSDASFSGDKPMVSKGHIDPSETPKEAAIRKAEEELGLKLSNLDMDTGEKVWEGKMTGHDATYTMTIFVGKIRVKKNFGKPHYETKATHWMTLDEFKKKGRVSHVEIVQSAHDKLKH